jgi:3-phosphoshikimate 1-carboxyvinyltransferase
MAHDRIAVAPLETPPDWTVGVPGSKSYTNRALLIGALVDGDTTLDHALACEDTELLANAVRQFGRARVTADPAADRVVVRREPGPMRAPAAPVHVGNAGTPIRFLMTLASLAVGRSEIDGNARMRERPCQDLVDALVQLGVSAEAIRGTGCPPVAVRGPSLRGGTARIRGSVSSQFTSSILLSAPYAERDVELEIVDELCSKPYVDMTIGIMADFGVAVERDGHRAFRVRAGQRYRPRAYRIEPDASNMSYFLAAAAILGGRVRIPGIGAGSRQGDARFVDVLEAMGCTVERGSESLALAGGALRGLDVDMNTMPDLVPTLAVVAAYARGRTRIGNIANLRVKECDRIAAMETELAKLGIHADSTRDSLTIDGGTPHGATVATYDDHRIAMAFAVAGLRTADVVIENPGCTAKSFPTFWAVLAELSANGAPAWRRAAS